MSKILVLKSSFMQGQSLSNQLIDTFLEKRKAMGEIDIVIEHDLMSMHLPVLDAELFHALRGQQNTDPKIQAAVVLSDQLIQELKDSDVLLIGAPMYNLNVPTQLKNWFDLVARAQVTFKYTATAPVGLVEGVNAIVFNSRGGIHQGFATDAVTPYLNSVLGLIGIDDVHFIYAEGTDMQPHGKDQAIKSSMLQIDQCLEVINS
ncbi:FMN-dependent NADH-azoreductase [Acinetobacter bouvetii]|uniref:FMN dependent NADH:quinone oxidoreductase n=1 Tax=Acinetobacter bouvetii TaxID=202951 RepID=A0A811GG50_9GAMM|nr:NAD(P)H-dependent oxidoreductase [Acinetobacter bouvetii]CAB1209924.1 FMN-dependent NADH-azoreductase [Acinetobacter bouvetii]